MNLKLIIALAISATTVAGCMSAAKMSDGERYYRTGHRSASESGSDASNPDPRATTYPSDPFRTRSVAAPVPFLAPAPVLAAPPPTAVVVHLAPVKRQGWFRRTGERVKTYYRQKKQRVRTFLGKTP